MLCFCYCLSFVASYVNPDHLQYFRFIGRLIAMVNKLPYEGGPQLIIAYSYHIVK